ncbi:aminotransferase class V-fold PLP-dependent enzyme [Marinomonas mediterranea]|jgi:Selenocysteine lyase|uniref:Cysteine desulfurase n=1 Tax=Marinomonas mediterranea (strain ATCC 700492 / JCM 21426 / NBRC 103028 / MMB-1) TaxID=717774 RepID=F2K0L4_MARM1|nr:aminotransferase class V-fold PLP-dependent enzyme [Marinomonas mediterranea]ADZ90998.1 Cysteine desulfurase [Marinomonas mediterranea MMB-1]WCN13068.1 aminotransferase class V-fold PLP-dependent enzyme [Marinomonas mediterranea]WCN17138.1 aminotransferase class V-fold PLP-dependent enzyme [Marinomonas mediterranea MMB-1]
MFNKVSLVEKIQRSMDKLSPIIDAPFGQRKITYADYTASGRALDFIEEAIQEHILPFYANTHTEANATGSQTTAYREEARNAIRALANANEDDLILFCGSGTTAAVNVLISQLNLHNLSQSEKDGTVIILGPYEHHSNELPWRSLDIELLRVPIGENGTLCMRSLEGLLRLNQGKRIIASFSAASNVSGVRTDDYAVTTLLNKYGAISVWDYAAAAPYVDVNMNPASQRVGDCAQKSALFFSMHKFVGGPGTPGILVVKKAVIVNHEPSIIGGGTVSFVTPENHTFLPIGERREEGGTPDIVGSIRAGLVAQLKLAVGSEWIEQREHELNLKIQETIGNDPHIDLLGETQRDRLTITSYRVKTKAGRYIHHGLIVALLNDLFGIQVRGGCSCAGPYGHYLLELDSDISDLIQSELESGNKFVKPGWVRFNLNYFISDNEADYILSAIQFTAEHAEKLSVLYQYDESQDTWNHIEFVRSSASLAHVFNSSIEKETLKEGQSDFNPSLTVNLLRQYFVEAHQIINSKAGESSGSAHVKKRFVVE